MRNTKTRRLLDYWRTIKGTGAAPARRAVNPRDLRGVLPYIFLADAVSPDVTAFRLAGTGLCERYGRELRDHNLQTMWTPSDRVSLRGLIARVLREPAPGLAAFRAETIDRRAVAGEMLLLPLLDQDGAPTKLLGSVFATESTASIGDRPLVHQRLEGTSLLDIIAEPAPEPEHPAPPALRRKGHLSLVVSQDTPPALAPDHPSHSHSL